jgi:hypothetical protein
MYCVSQSIRVLFTAQVDAAGNHTLMFGRGGNQGAEGFDAAAEWYIEGLIEELDAPGAIDSHTTCRKCALVR